MVFAEFCYLKTSAIALSHEHDFQLRIQQKPFVSRAPPTSAGASHSAPQPDPLVGLCRGPGEGGGSRGGRAEKGKRWELVEGRMREGQTCSLCPPQSEIWDPPVSPAHLLILCLKTMVYMGLDACCLLLNIHRINCYNVVFSLSVKLK